MELQEDVASALLEVASKHGSPAYVYHLPTVRARCRALRNAFGYSPMQWLYATKANNCKPVLNAIISSGFGLECVSLGEVLLALGLGASRILYTNNNVADAEWAEVVRIATEEWPGRVWLNCDSVSRISDLPRGAECFIRVNGSVGGGHHSHVITCGPSSKFGIPHEFVPRAVAAAAARGVKIIGLHQHIGSGVLDPARFAAAVDVLSTVVVKYAPDLPHLRFVNFGGGIGVPYKPDQAPIDLKALGEWRSSHCTGSAVVTTGRSVGHPLAARLCVSRCPAGALVTEKFNALCTTVGRPLTLVLEPGRYPVAESGFLLATVNTVKETPYGRCIAAPAPVLWRFMCHVGLPLARRTPSGCC